MITFLSILLLSEPKTIDLEQLSFMWGHWINESSSIVQEEWWTDGRGDMMLGVSRTVKEGHVVFFEYTRIEKTVDGIFFIASPSGQPTASFKLVESSPKKAVFENPSHDYPQRIIYISESPGHMKARIEGQVGGKEKFSEWTWKKTD